MKLNAGKRILMFFYWLLSLIICAVFAIYVLRPELVTGVYAGVTSKLSATQIMIIGIVLLAIYVILAVVQGWIIFGKSKKVDRGLITVDSSESGKVRIAVTAIEHMVRHSVTDIDGIEEMKIDIENLDDAIAINVAAILRNGCHVPTVTMNMQQAIRKFVEMNCGVAVRSVSVNINAVSNNGEVRRKNRKAHVESVPSVVTPEAEKPAEQTSEQEAAEVPAGMAEMSESNSAEPETAEADAAIEQEVEEGQPVEAEEERPAFEDVEAEADGEAASDAEADSIASETWEAPVQEDEFTRADSEADGEDTVGSEAAETEPEAEQESKTEPESAASLEEEDLPVYLDFEDSESPESTPDDEAADLKLFASESSEAGEAVAEEAEDAFDVAESKDADDSGLVFEEAVADADPSEALE